ncbi:alkyl sulfatase BDS1-like metallo-beta-lactamase superfamily hydrolase [Mesorhizobium soli]|uniref:alkyl sulfatase dimerization domain-containing protein n=1 Tax=Pseudaminobacter soli (ex Li et al. 2025) TaxID=1295366 RepID=UPI0024763C74|nr:alkyl sulfatase dimerization domain-containing protein [Mesorhizobium soli]MDH6233123.1 alkyl sulfatase BDS1-like metallo-beta-lactamase superfamily hydrolase [Mesorhizobium soli]
MSQDPFFERLWNGSAQMEEWTAAVSHGAITHVAENIITVHTTYFCGSVTAIRTSEGLVLIDTAKPETARQTLDVVRSWDNSPIHTVIFTHGHIDHTSGITVIDEEADARGVARPRIIAHRNLKRRMDRYEASHGFNSIVQGQQFNMPGYVYPIGQRRPDEVYDDTLALSIGGERFDLFHGRGETDDATFVWLPERRVLASGDFVIWVFPNAGNPRKVQRYTAEWAVALRQMEQLKPAILIPGHGPVVFGEERATQMLRDGAEALEHLVRGTLALMNKGATLDDVLRSVKVPAEFLAKPYLLPKYDDPEFLVRSIYHFYAGWFDGNPAHLKPAPATDLALELAGLVGGARKLAERAAALSEAGQSRLAVQLVEFAHAAAPDDQSIQVMRAAVLRTCIESESSLMGKAFLAVYEREAEQRAKG